MGGFWVCGFLGGRGRLVVGLWGSGSMGLWVVEVGFWVVSSWVCRWEGLRYWVGRVRAEVGKGVGVGVAVFHCERHFA